MKKFSKLLSILLCLSMLLSFMPTIASAATTESMDIIATQGVLSDKTITWTSTNFTFVNAQANSTNAIRNSDSDHFRAYAKSETTITALNGKKIEKIVITSISSYVPNTENCTYSAGSVSVSGTTVTVTFDTPVETLVITAVKQWRLKNIQVTFKAEAGECTHTNSTYISTMAGHQQDCTDCDYVGTVQAHTFTNKVCVCGYELYTPVHMDKVTLYHPTSDTSMSSTAYNGKLSAGEAVELVVVVDNDGHYSFVDPEGRYLTSAATGNGLSFANAASDYSLWDLEVTEAGWYIKNVNAAYNENSQYLEYYNAYTTYGLNSGGSAYAFFFVKTGTATEIPEFQCPHSNISETVLICSECREIRIDANSTLTQILDTAFALESGEAFPITVELTGKITEIVTAYDSTYENVTVNMVVNGKTIQAYRMKGTGADVIGVGDTITVSGTIKNHYDTVEFDTGCTLVSYVVHTCADSDPADHKCDICDATISECTDSATDGDHKCDICGEPIANAECSDSATDNDHNCDDCGAATNEPCSDKSDDADHNCDICGAPTDEACTDAAADGDHKCDICGEPIANAECSDTATDNDHNCDDCGAVTNEACSDAAADGDHKCDICGKDIENALCADADDDKDHNCDDCGKVLSDCSDDNKDHKCDVCEEVLSQCKDSNKEHHCDICKVELTKCADEDMDHDCDLCGEELTVCADTDPADHKCDICESNMSVCKDDDEDHICDICGTELCDDDHIDENNDHKCDACGAVASACADANSDHNCDVCGKKLTNCKDGDNNHKCDTCGKELTKCTDEDKDHECDVCGKELSKCADEDKDHKCDTCGKELSKCEWDEGKVTTEPTTDAEGVKTYTCTICGATKTEAVAKLEDDTTGGGDDTISDPAADSELSIKDATALGESKEHNTYTEGKYYITGVITKVYNTMYGNMYIEDEAGNTICIYGTFNADGTVRYDALEVKPVVGDTITVYGVIGQYNGTAQMKNGWITKHTVAEVAPDAPPATDVEDPAADSKLSVQDAIALGESKEHNTYTEGKYYVSGVIVEVYNETYGNMKIQDEAGNILTVYGTYDATGENRYDAMSTKPVAGDTVTVYGVIGQYNGTAQVKNGWITEHTASAAPDSGNTDSGNTDSDSDDTTTGDDNTTPSVPTSKYYGTLLTELKDGDKVVIYTAANGAVMTPNEYTYEGKSYTKIELEQLEAALTDEVLTYTAGAVVLTVHVDGETVSFTAPDGTYLYADGTDVKFVNEAGDNTKFVLEATDGGYFICCATATYNDKPQYLEVYGGYFTCYGMGTDPSIYTFQFYAADPDTPAATGDATISVVFALLLASAMGTAVVISKKKEF